MFTPFILYVCVLQLIQTPLEAQVNKIVRRDIMLGMMEVVKSEFQGGAVRMKLFLVSQADQTKSIATTQAKRLWVLVKEAFSHSDKMKSIMDTWRLDTKGQAPFYCSLDFQIITPIMLQSQIITPLHLNTSNVCLSFY